MKWVPVALVVLFPLLSHAGVAWRQPLLQWLALVLLVAIPLYASLARGQGRAWLTLAGLATGLYAITRAGGGMYLLYLPSIVIPALLAWMFGSTLAAGREPIITRIADDARPLTPELRVYTRRLTQMWTGIFVLMLAAVLVLAALGLTEWWSLTANFINYTVTGLVFGVEYLYRIHRYPDYDHPGFIEYLRILAGAGIRPTRAG